MQRRRSVYILLFMLIKIILLLGHMKYYRAEMFNRKASNPKNKPDQILETLALRPGQNIADIGSGGGYFTLRFAEAVGKEGLVSAVDTNPEFLEFIRSRAREKGLDNIRTILITEDNIAIPEKSLDFIFMRNVFHHLPNRVEYLRKLRSALKPDAKVAVEEHKRRSFFSFHRMFRHYVPQEVIAEEMKKAGYQVKEKFDFLPEQSFTIFSL